MRSWRVLKSDCCSGHWNTETERERDTIQYNIADLFGAQVFIQLMSY